LTSFGLVTSWVVRWVDRTARIYEEVCDPIREFTRRGLAIRTVIKNFTFDGATQRRRAAADCLAVQGE
jgi:DNA invertase Pin-like site-specific DNA recombinase